MPGYSLLGDILFPFLFPGNKNPIETKALELGLTLEQRGNVVIVHHSIPVKSLQTFFDAIKKRDDLSQKHILFGVEGQGVTEQHIVTMHLPPNGAQPIVYDSKHSDPQRFFSTAPSKSTMGNKIRSALYALNPSPSQTIDLSHLGCEQVQTATYHALGTQSFFDGVTCGYHTGNLIKTLANFLEQGIDPNPKQLADASINPVTTSAQLLESIALDRVNMSVFAFLKKAWQDTFLPLTPHYEKDQYHLGHYFMGWPSQPNGSKIAYFLTLKFITAPLTNLLSLVTEFPLNVLSETFSFFKNKVLSWAPTHGLTQSIRSLLLLATMGIQGLFKGTYYLMRTITSPIVSFKDAQKVHPALEYLSALASVCFIGAAIAALAVFAPPILAAIMPTMGPGALAMLNTLAYPFVQLFSLVSLSIPAATGAMLTFAAGILSLGILHRLGRKTIYPEESQAQENNQENAQSGVIALSDSDDDLLDEHLDSGPHHLLEDEHLGKDPGVIGTSRIFYKYKQTKKKTGDDFKPDEIQATIGYPP